mmetsp:Transcript_1349/g.2943  ORF Transcript_1349/g.2943 Transcript_1349/m.2943 type:complete len:251 (+) Transcript_1349:1083-1835(+)
MRILRGKRLFSRYLISHSTLEPIPDRSSASSLLQIRLHEICCCNSQQITFGLGTCREGGSDAFDEHRLFVQKCVFSRCDRGVQTKAFVECFDSTFQNYIETIIFLSIHRLGLVRNSFTVIKCNHLSKKHHQCSFFRLKSIKLLLCDFGLQRIMENVIHFFTEKQRTMLNCLHEFIQVNGASLLYIHGMEYFLRLFQNFLVVQRFQCRIQSRNMYIKFQKFLFLEDAVTVRIPKLEFKLIHRTFVASEQHR